MSRFCCRFILYTLLGWLSVAVLADSSEGRSPRILVFGDSISAAYGIELEDGWVALLQARLRSSGRPHVVVNASVSGETTAGGRARLPALLAQDHYAVVVLELGGNDGLRGLSLNQTEINLRAMIETAQAAAAKVLLLGMRLPPNYGPAYTDAFAEIFPKLAQDNDTGLVPFLLDAVATVPELMQLDRIHPRAEAQTQLLDLVWAELVPLL